MYARVLTSFLQMQLLLFRKYKKLNFGRKQFYSEMILEFALSTSDDKYTFIYLTAATVLFLKKCYILGSLLKRSASAYKICANQARLLSHN